MEGTDAVIARAGTLAGPGGGRQGGEAETGHALRRAGGGRRDDPGDGRRRRHRAVDRRRQDAADRRRRRSFAAADAAGIASRSDGASATGVTTPLRVGVVGVGHLGQHHARLLSGMPAATLVAVADIDAARARRSRRRHGAAALDPLARRCRARRRGVDCGADGRAREVALGCIEAGMAVLVEKPMAASSRRPTRIIEAAARRGVTLRGRTHRTVQPGGRRPRCRSCRARGSSRSTAWARFRSAASTST